MKQQAKNVSRWKLGTLSALGALLFVGFACSEEQKRDKKEIETDRDHLTTQNELNEELFVAVEEQPEFVGGMDAFYQYVASEVAYPLLARQQGVQGQVFVQFVVEKDGSLSYVRAVKGVGAGCDREAVRVVQNAPAFRPGKQRGKPVRVRMVMPVTFKLNEGETSENSSPRGETTVAQAKLINSKLKVDASYADGKWSGTVYDEEEGKGLPGANIVVAGTTTGTVSDLDGNFSVPADESNDIYISFVGYESVRLEGK